MKTKKSFTPLKAIILAFITAFVAINISTALAGDDKITIGEKFTLTSKILNEDRQMLVYLPNSYGLTEDKYPVMYLLDGGSHYFHASGITQFLSTRGKTPEMIVIALVNVDRSRDFSPSHTEKIPTSGGAEKFLSFLSDELIPYVNRNYRTQSYDILVGHSFGGTFATYTLLEKPETFDAYIAISPYLAYDDNLLVKKAESDMAGKFNHRVHFYMTLGDEPEYFQPLDDLTRIAKQKSPKGLVFDYVKMPDEDHGSIPHLSIYKGLEFIYADWQLSKKEFMEGLTSVDNHYKKLSKTYGYTIKAPEGTLNTLGYYHLGNKEFAEAINVFKENTKRYPSSANVYDSLGEAYEKNGQSDLAVINYEKAVELGKKEDHPYLNTFIQNLQRVNENLADK